MSEIKKVKPSLPSGTRDFLPQEVAKRNYIFGIIKSVFEQYGFQQIETPVLENLSTLTGKYGEEGDQLLFKVLDSGDLLKDIRLLIENYSLTHNFFFQLFKRLITQTKKNIEENIISGKQELYDAISIDFFQSLVENNIDNDLCVDCFVDRTFGAQVRETINKNIVEIHSKFIDYLYSLCVDNTIDNLSEDPSEYNLTQFATNVIENIYQNANVKIKKPASKTLLPLMSSRGLRYDLTVPLARYVVQHQNDLVFPFKRYHIAPVWRADRPQKGRYREFYQCDADIIGSNSLLNEVELTLIFSKIFLALNLNTEIRINNRKILEAIAVYASCEDKLETMTVAIDKLDKIGIEGINNELLNRGFTEEQINKVKQVLVVKNLEELTALFASIPVGLQGIEELAHVMKLASSPSVVFDVTLARGLNYYTGVIWEIKSLDSAMGSIGSGGRYANLTEMFGGRDMSGVGISFGVERIYDIMEELKLFPQDALKSTEVLFVHFSEANRDFAFPLVQQLRNANVATELYPDKAKMEKQMKYANAKGIPYVVVIGDNEMLSGKLAVKDMRSGTQEEKTFTELLSFFTEKK